MGFKIVGHLFIVNGKLVCFVDWMIEGEKPGVLPAFGTTRAKGR